MHREAHKSLEGGNGERNRLSGGSHVTVLILWETFAAASAARNLCQELEEASPSGFWVQSMWKFELLEMPKLCEQAAREAVQADWIIVAFENNSAPSPGLKHWLDSWEANASGKRQSLVALCVPTFIASTEGDLLMELRSLADRIECSFQGPSGGPPDSSSENVRF